MFAWQSPEESSLPDTNAQEGSKGKFQAGLKKLHRSFGSQADPIIRIIQ